MRNYIRDCICRKRISTNLEIQNTKYRQLTFRTSDLVLLTYLSVSFLSGKKLKHHAKQNIHKNRHSRPCWLGQNSFDRKIEPKHDERLQYSRYHQ